MTPVFALRGTIKVAKVRLDIAIISDNNNNQITGFSFGRPFLITQLASTYSHPHLTSPVKGEENSEETTLYLFCKKGCI